MIHLLQMLGKIPLPLFFLASMFLPEIACSFLRDKKNVCSHLWESGRGILGTKREIGFL